MEYMAERRGISRFVAECDTRNAPSRRVMERLGLTFEREQERIYPDARGKAREYVYRSVLAAEAAGKEKD